MLVPMAVGATAPTHQSHLNASLRNSGNVAIVSEVAQSLLHSLAIKSADQNANAKASCEDAVTASAFQEETPRANRKLAMLAKPAEKPAERPAERPAEKLAEKPAER